MTIRAGMPRTFIALSERLWGWGVSASAYGGAKSRQLPPPALSKPTVSTICCVLVHRMISVPPGWDPITSCRDSLLDVGPLDAPSPGCAAARGFTPPPDGPTHGEQVAVYGYDGNERLSRRPNGGQSRHANEKIRRKEDGLKQGSAAHMKVSPWLGFMPARKPASVFVSE